MTATQSFKHLKPYVRPTHYFGETFEEYYPVYGRHRDSDLLTESNFHAILEELGGESDTVCVQRASHFAVGWVETIYVHENDTARLETADSLLERIEQYPALDEDDWRQREFDRAHEVWKGSSLRDRIEWCHRFHVSIFAARRFETVPEDESGELLTYLATD